MTASPPASLQEWADCLLEVDTSGDEEGRDEASEARRVLEAAAARIAELPPGSIPLPVRITKGRAADVLTCEAFALARMEGGPNGDEDAFNWARLRGIALDAYVAHVNFAGPVADAVEDLRSMLRARDEPAILDALEDALDGPEAVERESELTWLAAAADQARVDAAWVPRVEVSMGVDFGGTVRVSGRVDLLLGGRGTARPALAVEVKSGGNRASHHPEAHHYALLCALRQGRVPAGVALWYPDVDLVPISMGGVVLSAAHRAADVAERLAELVRGDEPGRRPGPQCGWCPMADGCAEADAVTTGADW